MPAREGQVQSIAVGEWLSCNRKDGMVSEYLKMKRHKDVYKKFIVTKFIEGKHMRQLLRLYYVEFYIEQSTNYL